METQKASLKLKLEKFLTAAENFDCQKYGDFFTAEAVKIDPNGSEPVSGRHAIVERFKSKRIGKIKSWRIHRDDMYFSGKGAALLWRVDLETKSGEKSYYEGIDIFEFNDEGLCNRMVTFPRKSEKATGR